MSVPTPLDSPARADVRTARLTGGAYAALAVTGMLGFLLLRPGAQADGTAISLLVALELLTVMAQAGAAVGFYALLRRQSPAAAFAVAAFGMANASAILASAAFLATAAGHDPGPEAFALFFTAANAFWGVGAVFFGLWLIPMGLFVVRTRRMPAPLGIVLLIGGALYVADAVLAGGAPGLPGWISDVLVIPATVGELWMLGYLLIIGIRPQVTGADGAGLAGSAGS